MNSQASEVPAYRQSPKNAEASGQHLGNEAMGVELSENTVSTRHLLLPDHCDAEQAVDFPGIWDESDDRSFTAEEPLDTTRAALSERKAVARRAFLRGGRSITHFSRRAHRLAKDYGGAISIRSSQLTNLDNATAYGTANAMYKQHAQNINDSVTLQSINLSQDLQSQHMSGWIHIVQDELNFDFYTHKVSDLCAASPSLKDPVDAFIQSLKNDKGIFARRGHNHQHLDPFFRLKTQYGSSGGIALTLVAACFPFIRLETHPSSKLLDSASHPNLTLFQSKNGRHDQSFDRHQAMYQAEKHPSGRKVERFLHVTQLWLFMINDELLNTCCTLDDIALRGEVIKVVPPPTTPHSIGTADIQVITPNQKVWLLDSSECATWFDFTLFFVAFSNSLEDDFEVSCGETIICASNWHTILDRCKSEVVRLGIACRAEQTSYSSGSSEIYSLEMVKKEVARHTQECSKSIEISRSESKLSDSHNNSPARAGIRREEYAKRLNSWQGSDDSLSCKASSASTRHQSSAKAADYRNTIALMALVRQLIDFERPGGLNRLEEQVLRSVADLFEMSPLGFRHGPKAPEDNKIAASLFDLALTLDSNGCARRIFRERGLDAAQDFDEICKEVVEVLEKLKEGLQKPVSKDSDELNKDPTRRLKRLYKKLLERLRHDIADRQVVTLDGLVALLFSRLVHMPVLGERNIMDVYRDHMNAMDMDARLGEPSLGPLSRLRYFKYELAAFRGVQDQQWEVLDKMIYDLYRFDADQGNRNPRSGKHWLTNVKGEHKYNGVLRVVAGCFETLSVQDDLISGWDAEINHIRDECRARLEEVQDWRENAAVVFTVVTVLFLPLSFVASVFGMNTSDVRDMPMTQWAFWASAIPFTVLVVALALYWVDVPPLRRWWMRKRGSDAL